ncbi:MAG: S41 family peptidase [bacterium]|nr:S41 family peptidase [bacterium]
MSDNVFFQDIEPVPYLTAPALSPDGETLFFACAGDIWSVPASGGEARPVTGHAEHDTSPCVSPDGTHLAFISHRTGNGDLYVRHLKTGDLKRLTYHSGGCDLGGWSPDGNWLYFSANRDGINGAIFKIHADGGTPIEVLSDPRETHSQPALSPDGTTLAFVNDARTWWRKGPHPAGASHIWTVSEASGAQDHARVTAYAGINKMPMWSPDGRSIYYISDKGGVENLWSIRVNSTDASPQTHFEDGRCLRATLSGDGRWIAFERETGLWRLDLEAGEAHPMVIQVQPDQKITPQIHRTFSNDFDDFYLSPDGKKVLFTNHGELFAAPSQSENGTFNGIRITHTPFREYQAHWHPDSQSVVYLSDRFGNYELFQYDFTTREESRLTQDPAQKYAPQFSPDGHWIAYVHALEEIRLFNTKTGQIRPFIQNAFFTNAFATTAFFDWSPDSCWMVYTSRDNNYYQNLYVQHIHETQPHQITFLSHIGASNPRWSPNGKFILFNTGQYRSENQIVRVDLNPVPPVFQEEKFDELFEEEDSENDDAEEEGAEIEPVTLTFDNIKRRLRLLTPMEADARMMIISPDSKTVVFLSEISGQPNLWRLSLEPDKQNDPPRQITKTRHRKNRAYFTKDGEKLYYLDNGQIYHRDFPSGKPKKLSIRAEMDVDFHITKRQMFQEAWTLMRDHFYDPDLHGSDWDQVRDTFLPRVVGARTRRDLHDLLNLMVGELNASHLGTRMSAAPSTDAYLGLQFERDALEQTGRLKIARVLPEGPSAIVENPALSGDVLIALDGIPLNHRTNLWENLQHKVGKKVCLSMETTGGENRDIHVRPIGKTALGNLAYRDWVVQNTAYTTRISNGRLGYVHIRQMGLENLRRFLIDLDTEAHSCDGVVIDIRYNPGGHIATFILDVIAKRDFVLSSYRDKVTTLSANLSGNRILDKPTILLTNEHSGSNSEMFSEGYRRLGLGHVVGTPTAGAVIWTGDWTFLDGSTFRLPHIRVTTAEGENLERAPRPVDFHVERPLGEAARGIDSQLDEAAELLLGQIDAAS